jgi:hypothetical protein
MNSDKNTPNLQYGGSPASDIVMSDSTGNPAVLNDYITSPRIRDSWYSDALYTLEPRCRQQGGSLASDLVNEQLNQKAKTEPYSPAWNPKGDMNSLNLYQTTGGSRRLRKSKKSSRKHKKSSKKNNRNTKYRAKRNENRTRNQRGGGSDWITSQYSLGPSNNPEQAGSWVSQFSQSTATSRNDYMNPSTLGLAGSGYPMSNLEGGNVHHIGAPLV